jgi:hypothetical protein
MDMVMNITTMTKLNVLTILYLTILSYNDGATNISSQYFLSQFAELKNVTSAIPLLYLLFYSLVLANAEHPHNFWHTVSNSQKLVYLIPLHNYIQDIVDNDLSGMGISAQKIR